MERSPSLTETQGLKRHRKMPCQICRDHGERLETTEQLDFIDALDIPPERIVDKLVQIGTPDLDDSFRSRRVGPCRLPMIGDVEDRLSLRHRHSGAQASHRAEAMAEKRAHAIGIGTVISNAPRSRRHARMSWRGYRHVIRNGRLRLRDLRP